ncbi:MAG: DNA polymerase I, partial [Lachnospiraceae bacterium]|nr:DNA polymerase I [Lachnospiraceae bacterium]
MEKLLLIDGNSIMNRAFYGVPDLTNVNGLHTNAVYGFLNILFRFLDEENPDYLAIAFDLHAPTFRHKLFEAYKGTRKGMPDELRQQVPYIKNLVKEMNIKTLELEGYEADDLLGTMAKRAQNMGMEVSLLSGDRDLLQISDEHIKIRVPKTIKGQTTVEDYYPADVVAKYNVTPSEFIHLKALMGDSSDNIPGVPKVGEKTASELIIKYHSLDGIYENVEEISKDSIRNSLKDNKDLAYLCLKLATIETNAPVDVDFSELKNELTYSEGGYNILQELGLRTYLKKFEDNMSKIKNDVSLDNLTVTEIENNDALMSLLNGLNNASVSLVKGTFGSVIGINDKFYKVSFMMNINPFVRKVLFEGNNKLIVFKASDAFETLEDDDFKKQSKDIVKNIYALDLAAYLLNPLNNSYTAESLLSDYLGITVRSDSLDAKEQALVAYGFNELKKNFDERLNETEQYKLYTDIELPLSLVLFEMERTGILVDRAGLKKYEEDLSVSINSLEKKIYEEAGEEFNILSPKQLGVILFEKMNMPSSKKTKTGYSTSADVLEKLAADYPFVSNILEYRTLTKLKSTYAVGLASAIGSDGRIHSHFLQTVTATGRISSAEPNLQNIPVRTDLGRQLR